MYCDLHDPPRAFCLHVVQLPPVPELPELLPPLHVPETQDWLLEQTLPQAPQLFRS